MASDVSSETIDDTLPIFHAFDRPVPENLQSPAQLLKDALGDLDHQIQDLEQASSKPGASATAQRAAEYRKTFQELEKKSLQEMAAKKPDEKKLAKFTEEAVSTQEVVNAELEVPVREQGVTKALDTLKGRKQAALAGKIAGFEKLRDEIAKEKDPAKRCDRYFQLERDVIKADLFSREQDDPGSTWQDQMEIALQDSRPVGKVAKLKNKIRKSEDPISDGEFQALKTAFVNSSVKKISDMAYSVPKASREKFEDQADQAITALTDATFNPSRKPTDRQALGKLLVEANIKAMQKLAELKRKYPPNVTPQVSVEDGKIVITKAAPKVESLVLQGGGSKGAGYPPMLEEMKNAGILDKVDLLVGTSIGALNASCLACGGLADERQILDMPMMKQVFDSKDFKKQYPDVTFGKPGVNVSDVLPSCAGQMAKIDQMTASSIADNLKSKSENDLSNELSGALAKLDDDTLAKLGLKGASNDVIEQEVKKLAKKVKNQDFKSGDRMGQMITFKDLALLHQIDPVNFKELTITGWEGTGDDGHVVYFNAKDYGDMPVALAARISMGLPIFAPLYWNGRGPFYDGGLGSNAPVEATPGLDEFYKGKSPADAEEELKGNVPVEVQDAMAKTMLMTFDDKGKGERNLFGQGRTTAAPSGMENATVIKPGLNREYGKTLTNDATKVYNTGVNTLEVYHGDMDTVTLNPSADDFEYAENMSRMKGLEQLDARQDQAAMVTCTNTDEALVGMSSADKRNLVKTGRPQGGDPLVGELYDKCVAYVALEDAFQARGNDSAGFLAALAKSSLCASCAGDVQQLTMQYNVHVKGDSNAEALTAGIKTTSDAIGKCPASLQSMLKQAILLPMQQRRRGMPEANGGSPPTFLWQQEFSAQAFERTMTTAASADKAVEYLKEASAACDALKKYESRQSELAGKTKPKDVCETSRAALTALEGFLVKLRIMAGVQPYPKIPTLQDYVRWLQDKAGAEADRLRATAVKGKDANYPAHNFVAWDKNDWEREKNKAVEAGAIEDPGSTDFGAIMEKAAKTAAAVPSAADDAKEKASKAAWNAWDRLIRKAKEVQGMTDNANFVAYLQGCVTQAQTQRDLYMPP